MKNSNALVNKLLDEYAGNHCPIKADEAVIWVNQQLGIRQTNSQIWGLSVPAPEKQTCTPLAGFKFAHVKGLQIRGVTILNPADQGFVVTDSPGALVQGNNVIYGNVNKVQVGSPQPVQKESTPQKPTTPPQ